MKRNFLAGGLLLTMLSTFAQVGAEPQEEGFPNLTTYREPRPVRYFDPETDSHFSDPELALKMRVIYEEENPDAKEHNLNQRTNHFCLIGYEWQDGMRQVPVFWREIEEMTWWRGRSDPRADSEEGVNTLYLYSRHTNVEKDTVSTDADGWGSTYLRLRAGVIEVIRDCALHGRWVVIEPFEIPPACDGELGECELPDVHPLSRRLPRHRNTP
ncbi:MAG: hypothetical protein LBD06_00365 [Candidatus Accumulibacter sp.]|jgi:hypothetical protein|nr:hypothetical protein [Accumulibacter sp.]